MATQVLTYHFKSGTDKDGNTLYTFEAREKSKNATVIREGLYKQDAEDLARKVSRNPEHYGF